VLCCAIMDDPLRLVVLSDDPLSRAGLTAFLATLPSCQVVGQASAAGLAEAAAGAADTAADVIVWDAGWDMPADRDEPLERAVPVLALVPDVDGAAVAWALGSRGIIGRTLDEEALLPALQAVAAGLVVFAPHLIGVLREPAPANAAEDAAELTTREGQVLALLAEGLTNKAIAQRLTISDHTVKFHVNAILSKLNAQSRTDAVVRATRQGLLSL